MMVQQRHNNTGFLYQYNDRYFKAAAISDTILFPAAFVLNVQAII